MYLGTWALGGYVIALKLDEVPGLAHASIYDTETHKTWYQPVRLPGDLAPHEAAVSALTAIIDAVSRTDAPALTAKPPVLVDDGALLPRALPVAVAVSRVLEL